MVKNPPMAQMNTVKSANSNHIRLIPFEFRDIVIYFHQSKDSVRTSMLDTRPLLSTIWVKFTPINTAHRTKQTIRREKGSSAQIINIVGQYTP